MSKLSLSAGLNLCHFIWRRTHCDCLCAEWIIHDIYFRKVFGSDCLSIQSIF